MDNADSTSLESRVAVLEKDVEELKGGATAPAKTPKAKMLATFGVMPDDEVSREAERLGRKWRERQPKC